METNSQNEIELHEILTDQCELILWNDNHNTFDHVIECLVKYCEHSRIQAEQCAYLVHHKGKCIVKRGPFEKVVPIANSLLKNGLTAEVK